MSGFADYEQYDALGLADLVRRRKVTPTELLEAAIERVEARNPAVNAVVTEALRPGPPHHRRAACPTGPFTGVPYLMKDLTASIAGVPMTRGSRFFADTPPATADSEHVARLKRAGLVIFGRTSTCELGLSLTCEPQLYGPTRNPWDPTRISGGSSGGAAAAVGARMLPMAHASDGFGSIRAPAACCGVVGLKPTRARNTFAPFAGEGLGGLSTEHAVTLTVRDCAALLDATAGPGAGDPYVAPAARAAVSARRSAPTPGTLRIAWTAKAPNGAAVERESLAALAETVKLCADLGHRVEEADPEVDGAAVVPTFLTLCHREHRGEPGQPSDGRPPRARGRGGAGDVADRPARREGHGGGLRARDPDRASARPPDGRLPPALRRAADPGPRHLARQARLDRHDAGRLRRVLASRLPLLALHGVVQHHRAARAWCCLSAAPRRACRWPCSSWRASARRPRCSASPPSWSRRGRGSRGSRRWRADGPLAFTVPPRRHVIGTRSCRRMPCRHSIRSRALPRRLAGAPPAQGHHDRAGRRRRPPGPRPGLHAFRCAKGSTWEGGVRVPGPPASRWPAPGTALPPTATSTASTTRRSCWRRTVSRAGRTTTTRRRRCSPWLALDAGNPRRRRPGVRQLTRSSSLSRSLSLRAAERPR